MAATAVAATMKWKRMVTIKPTSATTDVFWL